MNDVHIVKNNLKKIYHLFFICPKVRHFWNELRAWLYTNIRIDISLDDRKILFSFDGKNDFINYIYVLAKFYIYQTKFISMNISIQGNNFYCWPSQGGSSVLVLW